MDITIDYRHFWQFNNIKRYSIRLNQHYPENDSEHSFFVAIIVAKLMDHFNFHSYNLLKFSLIHDIGELITGDINTGCKTPALRKELHKIEEPIIEAYSKYLNISKISDAEESLLKAADVLTTYFYGKMNGVEDIRVSGFKLFKFYLRQFKKLRAQGSDSKGTDLRSIAEAEGVYKNLQVKNLH